MALRLQASIFAMACAVASAHTAGVEITRSGSTPRSANRLPISCTSRMPRSFGGRSRSDKVASSQLDLAWRTRSSIFIPPPARSLRRRVDVDNGRHDTLAATCRALGSSPLEADMEERRKLRGRLRAGLRHATVASIDPCER